MPAFAVYRQHDSADCGPTCLRMIARHHGRICNLAELRTRCEIGRDGVSLHGIAAAAQQIGLRTLAVRASYELLSTALPLPCIAHWRQNHFVVIHKIAKDRVHIADPAHGHVVYRREDFLRHWLGEQRTTGIVLLFEPTPEFRQGGDVTTGAPSAFGLLAGYLRGYRRFLFQLGIGLSLEGGLAFVAPFLTQALVDHGVSHQNLGFVYSILLAQLMLFAARTAVELLRRWILLHIGARINVALISDYLLRLMRLPMKFFDQRLSGDILQRVDDHRRVETFLTSSTLSVLFSLLNLSICTFVLAAYHVGVGAVFLGGTLASAAWIALFVRRRAQLDYQLFACRADNRAALTEILQGMHEIKLNRCEDQKRWGWERLQARLFSINQRHLQLTQIQQVGSLSLHEFKNIVIMVFAASQVVAGEMTLGMMLAISYLIGQASGPVQQLLDFMNRVQDARLSLERLGEIQGEALEDSPNRPVHAEVAEGRGLSVRQLSFRYQGTDMDVLKDVDLDIPAGKVTAIVGPSGSGKTTLVKLLLKFYRPTAGQIRVGDVNLENLATDGWRARCGAVLQDGFIFSDTVSRNIAPKDEHVAWRELAGALSTARIREHVEALPLSTNTKIGADGLPLSGGQRQRILIARAVYKAPEFLFFDEATSALDAENERGIIENLRRFFAGRTVVVVAHRLSTVKHADQIVVLDRGRVAERGSHDELVRQRGVYFKLVKDQLELGA